MRSAKAPNPRCHCERQPGWGKRSSSKEDVSLSESEGSKTLVNGSTTQEKHIEIIEAVGEEKKKGEEGRRLVQTWKANQYVGWLIKSCQGADGPVEDKK